MDFFRERMTRRALLGRAAAGVGVVVLGAAGCTGGEELSRASGDPSAPPIARSPGDCGVRPGFVTFPPSGVVSSNGSPTDTSALREVIVSTWERYLHVDEAGLRTYLADDCIRMSGGWGAGTVQRGGDTIVAQLESEAQATERPTGVMAQEHAISNAELWFDPSGTAATAVYHDAVLSGYRWCDSNEGVVLQAFTKQAGHWRVAHWTDSFHSTLGTDELGDETFKFDFSYPATDLDRAVDFYTPILGPPESLVEDRAVFLLPRGWRFFLDAAKLDGIARVSSGLPNGWATIYVEDVEAQRERLKGQGVQFVAGSREVLHDGPDLYAVGLDEPDQNPFVLLQRNYSTNGPSPSTPQGFTGETLRSRERERSQGRGCRQTPRRSMLSTGERPALRRHPDQDAGVRDRRGGLASTLGRLLATLRPINRRPERGSRCSRRRLAPVRRADDRLVSAGPDGDRGAPVP